MWGRNFRAWSQACRTVLQQREIGRL